MAEKNQERRLDSPPEAAPEHYYDYEARFIKQKREQERINILPRVIKPVMFARGEFALGDMRIFSRYTVAPLSALTCGFLALAPGAATAPRRMIPSLAAYIIEGGGECLQDGVAFPFAAGDVVIVPPWTHYRFAAGAKGGLRAWLPQVRLWHGQGLLCREPGGGTNPDQADTAAAEKINAVFRARRAARPPAAGKTRYDWFLSRLAEENRVEKEAPRVIRGADRPWEITRQGKLKFLISRWTEVAARGLDMTAEEIGAGGRSGEHRHIFEELLLVVRGRGHDLHEGTRHPWEAGDLICVPPMITHRHVNDGSETARLVSVWPRQPGHEFLGGIEQMDDASDRQA